MAKNKKQDRSQQQHASQAERGQEQAQKSSAEARNEQHLSQMTPADVARKGRQKRFGHN
ncbi:hypothetical protein [Streptomyces broussonetiae]|uniref:hypothetical protein n=1 Tax=Streptomyces broussonetiae TaxID=2686304 RepID=UPI0018EF1D76|nr:hypothetical protein [Streptomyces broussonetiae]